MVNFFLNVKGTLFCFGKLDAMLENNRSKTNRSWLIEQRFIRPKSLMKRCLQDDVSVGQWMKEALPQVIN